MKVYFILGILFCSIGSYAQDIGRQILERELDRNHYDEVLRGVDSLYRIEGKSSDLLFYEGKANEGMLRYKAAYRCYSEWLERDSSDRDARLALARVAALAGWTMKAVDIYEQLAGEDSLDFFVNYQLARLYQQIGKTVRAIGIYDRLYQTDTTNVTLLKRIGDCYNRIGWSMNAVDHYLRAFCLDPEDGETVVKAVNLMMANTVLFPDFIGQSGPLVDTALIYSPRLNALKQLRGILYYLSRRYFDCETTFEELIAQGDSTRVNFKYLGLALFHMNRFKEAVVPLAIADSLFQDDWGNRLDPELSMRYGETLGKCRETEKAMKVLGEIERQMMPDTLMLYRLAFLRGNACEEVDKREQAVCHYWRAYKLKEDNKNIIYTLMSFHCGLWTVEGRRWQASEEEVSKSLFFHVLFLQKMKALSSGERHYFNGLSGDILRKELDELFFRQEATLVVVDPDGKKYTYSADEMRELIKP